MDWEQKEEGVNLCFLARSGGGGMQYHQGGSRMPPFARGGAYSRGYKQLYAPPQQQPPPQDKHEVLMEAGRLAAEYLVAKGVLPPASLQRRGVGGGGWVQLPPPPPPPPPPQGTLAFYGAQNGRRRLDDDDDGNPNPRSRRNRGGENNNDDSSSSYNGRGKRKFGAYSRHSDWGRDKGRSRGNSDSRSYDDEDDDGPPGYRRERRGGGRFDDAGSSMSGVAASKTEAMGESELEDTGSKVGSSSNFRKDVDPPQEVEGVDKLNKINEESNPSNSEVVEQMTNGESTSNNASCIVIDEEQTKAKYLPVPSDDKVSDEKPDDSSVLNEKIEDDETLAEKAEDDKTSDERVPDGGAVRFQTEETQIGTDDLRGQKNIEQHYAVHESREENMLPPKVGVQQQVEEGMQIYNVDTPPQDEDLIASADKEKVAGVALLPSIKAEAVVAKEEDKFGQSSSFKICDLNLVGSPEVAELRNDPGLGQFSTAGCSMEPQNQQQEFRNTGNSADDTNMHAQIPLHNKVVQVIDLEDDSPIEAGACDTSKAKEENMANPAVTTDVLPGIQDGYNFAISDYLGADIPCYQPMQTDLPNGMSLSDSEGITVMDDSIYGSLSDIGFMEVWDQQPQDYEKFF
ncbi:hypothetical protein OsI_15937 [Oryza sativa Indica Group]|uniref:Uncharacterized protein n=1 Tax=Oryza sativa subsp. indica TaxID=39946 RepID=A2XTK2_ORYSI|nr:hypothetical protein OsI_15937 [Oryza sativa Indica Group]